MLDKVRRSSNPFLNFKDRGTIKKPVEYSFEVESNLM